MTTLNPIDIDKPSLECVALIDLENIRLSWQRTYSRVFEYADLVLLCGLTEKLMDTPMSRIVVFATDPTEYKARQVQIVANRMGLLQGGTNRNLSEHEVRVLCEELKKRQVPLSDDVDAGFRIIKSLTEDAKASQQLKGVSRVGPLAALLRQQQQQHSPIKLDDDDDDDALSCLSSVSKCSTPTSDDSSSSSSSDDCEILNGDDIDEVVFLGESSSTTTAAGDKSEGAQMKNGSRKRAWSETHHHHHVNHHPSSTSAQQQQQQQQQVGPPNTVVLPYYISSQAVGPRKTAKVVAADGAGSSSGGSSHVERRLCDEGRQIELRLYGFKVAKGRAVQRGCDVALSAELTKTCFHPNVDKIVLFSADSDFQEIMQNTMEAENVGGVLKYAKTAWVCGFRQAFNQANIRALRSNRHKILGGHHERGVIVNGNLKYVVIDEVFPQIKYDLETQRAKRIHWAPQPFP